ncbi:MAG: 4Fe-4S binding protein [Planctomycetota bacterium]
MAENKANGNSNELPVLKATALEPPKKKTGRGHIRAMVLIGVHVIILIHISHYLMSGRTVSPVEPSEAMYTIELGKVNAGAIFFAAAILSTAVFGRFFCGWACHIVALQDLCSYLLRKIGIKPKPLRSRLLIVVPFVVAFYMFMWPTVYRLWIGSHHPGFSNHLLTVTFWKTFPGPVISVLTFLVCGGLIVYLLGNKGFCTYGCPYGAFFSVADRVAAGRIRVTDACHQCGQCTAHCTSNVMVNLEVKEFGMVVDPGCMKCMDCVSVCPNDALYFGLTAKKGFENIPQIAQEKAAEKPKRKKTYDFTLGEELFGLALVVFVLYSLRGLYDLMPLLLSTALAVITAYLVIQFARMLRKRDLRLQNFRLKKEHKFTKAGIALALITFVWLGFTIHSFLVQYNRYGGRAHLTQVPVTWQQLIDGTQMEGFTDDHRSHLEKAITNFERSDKLGFKDVLEVKLGLTVAHMMSGEVDTAESYLREAYEVNPDVVREMLMEFLASQDRHVEAEEFLRSNL